MRSSRVVRAPGCQCQRLNGPGFDPSVLRHRGNWGAADETVLNNGYKNIYKKSFLKQKKYEGGGSMRKPTQHKQILYLDQQEVQLSRKMRRTAPSRKMQKMCLPILKNSWIFHFCTPIERPYTYSRTKRGRWNEADNLQHFPMILHLPFSFITDRKSIILIPRWQIKISRNPDTRA